LSLPSAAHPARSRLATINAFAPARMVADMGNTPEMIVAIERTLNAYILLVLPILSSDF
jgi:hypothetical protein